MKEKSIEQTDRYALLLNTPGITKREGVYYIQISLNRSDRISDLLLEEYRFRHIFAWVLKNAKNKSSEVLKEMKDLVNKLPDSEKQIKAIKWFDIERFCKVGQVKSVGDEYVVNFADNDSEKLTKAQLKKLRINFLISNGLLDKLIEIPDNRER